MPKRILYCLVLILLLAPASGRAQQQEEAQKLRQEIGKLEDQLAATRVQLGNLEKLLRTLVEDQKKQAERRAVELRQQQIEAERRLREQEKLADRVRELIDQLAAARRQVEEHRAQVAQAQNQSAVLQQRNALLELRLRELEREMALRKAGVIQDLKPLPNPPKQLPAGVRGTVKAIEKNDPTLIRISLGSDAGVEVNQMVEVYRLQPRPQYLGRLRIVEVTPREAIGRLEGKAVPIQVGDEVAGRLTP